MLKSSTTVDDNNPSGSSDFLKRAIRRKATMCVIKKEMCRGKLYTLELPSTSIYLCLKNLRHVKRMYTPMWTEHSALSKQ